MHLYLIRHGQSFVNLADWDRGNSDEGLTPLGQAQAAALASWMPQEVPNPAALYCSTMRRARETAEPLAAAYQLPITWEDRVREIGNNFRDHRPFPNDSLPSYGQFWGSERPFSPISPEEDTEGFIHFRARVGIFLEEISQRFRGQNVIVVCHGGVIDAAFDHIFDTGIWRRCEVWSKNTSVTYFELVEIPNREVWRLHYQNRTTHLRHLLESRPQDENAG